MSLNIEQKKRLRTIGHQLKPVVLIGSNGLNEKVIAEIERALNDHELIKVKINLPERDDRNLIAEELMASVKAELAQMIGKVMLIYRRNPKPNPKLSNMVRYKEFIG